MNHKKLNTVLFVALLATSTVHNAHAGRRVPLDPRQHSQTTSKKTIGLVAITTAAVCYLCYTGYKIVPKDSWLHTKLSQWLTKNKSETNVKDVE